MPYTHSHAKDVCSHNMMFYMKDRRDITTALRSDTHLEQSSWVQTTYKNLFKMLRNSKKVPFITVSNKNEKDSSSAGNNSNN